MTSFPETPRIAVIGLGYVGLPLAASLAKFYPVVGYDIERSRIEELNSGRDRTREISESELGEATSSGLTFSHSFEDIHDYDVYIVTVPTPIDLHRRPDLRPLLAASETVGRVIRPGSVVVFESTVYPGATESDCIPVIERISNLKYNEDFFAGYSPERMNPGDRAHGVKDIVKVTSGSTPEVSEYVNSLYARVITAGTHKAPSIAVAEAAKVIENIQRDVNIALINEFAVLFNKLGLDTEAVLEAAGTKWNFLPFRPGLVGGHCIGVDPYYLTHKAQEVGFHPEMILAGRRINDDMGAHVATEVVKAMIHRGSILPSSRVLILGLAFKENTPDIRNTRVTDIRDALEAFGVGVDIFDPEVDPRDAKEEFGISILTEPKSNFYNAVILAVAHRYFVDLGVKAMRKWMKPSGFLFDVKYALPKSEVDGRL